MIFNKERIKIRVKGPETSQEIGIFLPWDANLDDWKTAFSAILTHQTFTADQINDLFFNEETDIRETDFLQKDPDWERENAN